MGTDMIILRSGAACFTDYLRDESPFHRDDTMLLRDGRTVNAGQLTAMSKALLSPQGEDLALPRPTLRRYGNATASSLLSAFLPSLFFCI